VTKPLQEVPLVAHDGMCVCLAHLALLPLLMVPLAKDLAGV